MNILVTGGAGFIGSHLCQSLLELRHNVIVIDNLSTGLLSNLDACIDNEHFTFIEGSILDKSFLATINQKIDIIFHLAAAVGVKYILENPLLSIHTNVLGTEYVLDYANQHNIKVILTSSSEVYGKSNNEFFKEDDDRVLGSTHITRWSYSCSKTLDEFIAFAYYRKHGLPVVIARLFNTCGPRQSGQYGMVIPRFIKQALDSRPITVYGDGDQIRSFTYVTDTVEALIQLVFDEKCEGEVFNIGGNEPIAIKDLALYVKEKTHSSSDIMFIPYEEAYGTGFEDMHRRVPDISKIKSFINFEPKVGIHGILDKTIRYITKQKNVITR